MNSFKTSVRTGFLFVLLSGLSMQAQVEAESDPSSTAVPRAAQPATTTMVKDDTSGSSPSDTHVTKLSNNSKISQSSTHMNSWRDLKNEMSTSSPSVSYFEFETENGSKAHLVVVDMKSKMVRLRPFVNSPGSDTADSANSLNAIAAVNGGYFNLSNGMSTSYVVVNGQTVCDPKLNPALVGNAKLAPFMGEIIDRTEVRFGIGKNGKQSIDIINHNSANSHKGETVDSLQAGPRLLPSLTAEKEAFVRRESDGKDVDSIGVHKTAARTAFGVTADGHVLIICIAGGKQDEFSSGVTLSQLAELMKHLGCVTAMNFDGGTSTTMVVALKDSEGRKMVCGRTPQTKVKSTMLVVPVAQ